MVQAQEKSGFRQVVQELVTEKRASFQEHNCSVCDPEMKAVCIAGNQAIFDITGDILAMGTGKKQIEIAMGIMNLGNPLAQFISELEDRMADDTATKEDQLKGINHTKAIALLTFLLNGLSRSKDCEDFMAGVKEIRDLFAEIIAVSGK